MDKRRGRATLLAALLAAAVIGRAAGVYEVGTTFEAAACASCAVDSFTLTSDAGLTVGVDWASAAAALTGAKGLAATITGLSGNPARVVRLQVSRAAGSCKLQASKQGRAGQPRG